MVLAGPGSGKTTVLTGRIKNLINKYSVTPSEILVITFTKSAALEMKERFFKICDKKYPVTFGTFHSVFFSILKAAYNYSAENILKDDTRYLIIKNAVESTDIETNDISELVGKISGEISRVKTENLDVNTYHPVNCSQDEFVKIYRAYEGKLKKSRLIDFDDMLLYCHELLSERRDLLEKWQNKYRYILVDEFQDINKIQYEVIKLLALPENNIFIVGDDDQSIYGFRGSKPDLMLNFDKDYPDTAKIVLDVNYRSSANIVAASGYVIGNNKARFEKSIHSAREKGEKIDIVEFDTMNDEYERVTVEVRKNIQQGKHCSDFAILYRTNSTVAPLVRKFMEYNIPFVIKDGVPDIFEHWIAKDILAYVSLADGGRERSDFIRIMNKPLRYISRDCVTEKTVDFEELIKLYEERTWMVERIEKFEKMIIAMSDMTVYAMINYIRKGIGYDDYLKDYADKKSIDYNELSEILDEIMDSARNTATVAEWKSYIDSYSKNLREKYCNTDTKEDAVSFMTMHGSKGLEYDTVFIVDANEGITPHNKSVFDRDIEEERRIFYVAMTRAKNNLKIFYSRKRYNKKLEPSRFVMEIIT